MTRRSVKTISVRVDDSVISMLNELEELEKNNDAEDAGVPLNRTQIIVQSLKMYYASRMNNKAMNAYVEVLQNSVEPMLQEYMMQQTKVLDKRLQLIESKMDQYSVKELLHMKMFLMGTKAKDDEDLTYKLLDMKGAFEDPIDEYVSDIMEGRRSQYKVKPKNKNE